MEIILLILVGTIMGAINVAFFLLGTYFAKKKENEGSLTVDKNNKDAIKGIMEWMNYRG